MISGSVSFWKRLVLGAYCLLSLSLTQLAFAHPGRTASDGCHYCRTNCNKYGVPHNERHCHGRKTSPPEFLKPDTQTQDQMVRGKPKILDGDTVVVGGNKIRLSGIDAPERQQTCTNAQKEPYPCGEIATQKLREHIGDGSVSCTLDTRDKYKRWLGVCTFDGTDLNGWMVERGYALVYRRYSTRYLRKEAEAESKGRGLWSGAFIEPWRWRRGVRLPSDCRESEGP